MKIVRDSAVRQEPAQPQAVSPEENRFSIRPRQIALFFLWMLAFTLLARGTSGALLPEAVVMVEHLTKDGGRTGFFKKIRRPQFDRLHRLLQGRGFHPGIHQDIPGQTGHQG